VTTLVLVAALDRARAIGRGNALPWHLPADLKRFKAITLGKPVLMGRKTAQAIGRALPGRVNLVLTRGAAAPFAGQIAVGSVAEALARADAPELMVIGGAEVYAQTLAASKRLLLTEVDTLVDSADAFFPAYDPAGWRETFREPHPADARHAFGFCFVDLERRL
jgi:dihydrofolate reductase